MKIKNREELIAKQEEYRASLNSQRKQILICAGTGCVAGLLYTSPSPRD